MFTDISFCRGKGTKKSANRPYKWATNGLHRTSGDFYSYNVSLYGKKAVNLQADRY